MSDQGSSMFGWDLLYGSIERDVKSNQDVLICFVHLALISNGFRCIGIGDSKSLDGTEAKSETLPKGWNDGYSLRYIFQGRLYNLKGSMLDDGIIVNLIRINERSVSMIQLNSRTVVARSASLEQMIPENRQILEVIKKQLIDKVITSTKTRETSCQTQQETTRYPSSDGIPSRLMEPARPGLAGIGPYMPNFRPGTGVGSNDLNPFGGNPLGMPRADFPGGGMLYEPPRAGPPVWDPNSGIPGGSLPPGARFDPFRPPDADRFPGPRRPANPDNDEMPPPGFDDMFM